MRFLTAVLAVALSGCTSQSTLETRPVTDSQSFDMRRRAEAHP